jgi:hypothetical protein
VGGIALKLNPDLVSGGEVYDFVISANSQRVIYRADQDIDERIELYSVSTTGGLSAQLNLELVALGNVSNDYKISSDSQYVVYRADQDVVNFIELYSVPILGGTVTKLNEPLSPGTDVNSFNISGNSDIVVYLADQDALNELEIFAHRLTAEAAPDEAFCVPIRASNGNIALICL